MILRPERSQRCAGCLDWRCAPRMSESFPHSGDSAAEPSRYALPHRQCPARLAARAHLRPDPAVVLPPLQLFDDSWKGGSDDGLGGFN